jgi:hypothetical protein
MKNYESNCGGKRRGCCLIIPVSDCDIVSNAVIVLRLPYGQYAAFPVVSKATPRTTRKHRKAPR